MSSSGANLFRLIPRFSRQNYALVASRIFSNREFSADTCLSRPNYFSHTPVRAFSKVKDSATADVFLEEVFDQGFEGDNASFDLRNFLYPDSQDPHIQALSAASSVAEVFQIFEQIQDLEPCHVTQSLATLHSLQKMCTNVPHDFQNQVHEKVIEYNHSLLNHEQFPSLLNRMEPLIEEMALDDAAFNILSLRKFGVALTDCVQVKLYLKLIHNVESLDLKCLSYLSCALRPRQSVDNKSQSSAWKYGLLPIIPRLDELLDTVTTTQQLRRIAICYSNMAMLISDKMMKKFGDKTRNFAEAGMYSTPEDIGFLKKHLGLVIAKADWHHKNHDYVNLLVNLHIGQTHFIRAFHLWYLYRVMRQSNAPIQLHEECFERVCQLMARKADTQRRKLG
jgi:hypothetical protein